METFASAPWLGVVTQTRRAGSPRYRSLVVDIYLVDTRDDEVIGSMKAAAFERSTFRDNAYVLYSEAADGFGPLMYETMMHLLWKHGYPLTPGTSVSDEAEAVWQKFFEREDYEKHKPDSERGSRAGVLGYAYRPLTQLAGLEEAIARGNTWAEDYMARERIDVGELFERLEDPQFLAANPRTARRNMATLVDLEDTTALVDALEAEYPVELWVYPIRATPGVRISTIRVPPEHRGEGIGTEVMDKITRWADERGATLVLTPESEGRTGPSKTALKRWYRRFGFVPNKGRAKDYLYTDAMIRRPSSRLNRGRR